MSLGFNYEDFSTRVVSINDAEMMLEWRNHARVRDGMFHSRAFTIDEQQAWLRRRIEEDSSHYFILSYRDMPRGVFGVYDFDLDQRVGEWVYFMGPRAPDLPPGAGAAGEFLALDTFFYRVGVRRLWGRTMRTNSRVWKMHERFGFTIEGVLREHVLKDDEAVDLLIVGLLEREWRAGRAHQFRSIFTGEGPPPPEALT